MHYEVLNWNMFYKTRIKTKIPTMSPNVKILNKDRLLLVFTTLRGELGTGGGKPAARPGGASFFSNGAFITFSHLAQNTEGYLRQCAWDAHFFLFASGSGEVLPPFKQVKREPPEQGK